MFGDVKKRRKQEKEEISTQNLCAETKKTNEKHSDHQQSSRSMLSGENSCRFNVENTFKSLKNEVEEKYNRAVHGYKKASLDKYAVASDYEKDVKENIATEEQITLQNDFERCGGKKIIKRQQIALENDFELPSEDPSNADDDFNSSEEKELRKQAIIKRNVSEDNDP